MAQERIWDGEHISSREVGGDGQVVDSHTHRASSTIHQHTGTGWGGEGSDVLVYMWWGFLAEHNKLSINYSLGHSVFGGNQGCHTPHEYSPHVFSFHQLAKQGGGLAISVWTKVLVRRGNGGGQGRELLRLQLALRGEWTYSTA